MREARCVRRFGFLASFVSRLHGLEACTTGNDRARDDEALAHRVDESLQTAFALLETSEVAPQTRGRGVERQREFAQIVVAVALDHVIELSARVQQVLLTFEIVILAVFSVVSWYLIVLKWWQFRKMRQLGDRFLAEVEKAPRLEDAYHAAMRLPPSPYNRLLREAVHLTGRSSLRAAQSTSASSG